MSVQTGSMRQRGTPMGADSSALPPHPNSAPGKSAQCHTYRIRIHGSGQPNGGTRTRGTAIVSVGAEKTEHPRKKVKNAFIRRGYPVFVGRTGWVRQPYGMSARLSHDAGAVLVRRGRRLMFQVPRRLQSSSAAFPRHPRRCTRACGAGAADLVGPSRLSNFMIAHDGAPGARLCPCRLRAQARAACRTEGLRRDGRQAVGHDVPAVDTTIEEPTKERYRQLIAGKIKQPVPTAPARRSQPAEAAYSMMPVGPGYGEHARPEKISAAVRRERRIRLPPEPVRAQMARPGAQSDRRCHLRGAALVSRRARYGQQSDHAHRRLPAHRGGDPRSLLLLRGHKDRCQRSGPQVRSRAYPIDRSPVRLRAYGQQLEGQKKRRNNSYLPRSAEY